MFKNETHNREVSLLVGLRPASSEEPLITFWRVLMFLSSYAWISGAGDITVIT